MTMGILTIAIYEFKKVTRNKVSMVILFVIPLLFILTLGFALKDSFQVGDNHILQVKVAIFNEDNGPISESLENYLAEQSVKELIKPIFVHNKAGIMEYINEGKANFGLFIPENFSLDITNSNETKWELISGYGLSKNITAQTVFGTFAEVINDKEGLWHDKPERYLEILVSENSHTQVKETKGFTSLHYYSVHMLLMFILYTGMMGAINLFLEKNNYTLARLYSVPIPTRNILIGKILAFGLIGLLQAIVIIFASTMFYDVDWESNYFRICIATLLMTFASIGLSLFIASLVKQLNGLIALSNVVIIFMTFLAGGFYPGMGGMAEEVSKYTPNYWAASMLLTSGENSLGGEVIPLAIISISLLIISFLLFLKRKLR